MEVLRKKRMTESDKYKTAQNAFSRISTELVDFPDDQFTDALNHLEAWWTRLRQGHVEMPTPAASGGGSQPNSDADADVPTTQVAVETSADANEKDETVHNEGDELTGAARGKCKDTANQTSCTKIKLKPFNPRTTRVGRPKKNKAAAAAKLSQSRKAYNKGSKLRSALRGDDVVDIAEFVKSCEPPLSDLSSFLDTFEVRYQKHKFKQLSVLRRVPEATVVPYRLPEALVREGLSLIERKIPYGFIMDVSTPVEPTEECWVLSVDGIGDFTQHQLMAMQYLWALVNSCRQGMQCYSWLMGPVDATFPNEDGSGVAKRIYEEWPLQRLPGFGEGLQIQWTHLYCAGSGCWYNDNLIMAFAKTLEVTFQGNTTILLPPMKIPDTQTTKKHGHLPPRTLSLISAAAKGLVFLPLNLNGNHWTCLVVDGSKATIYCYDSMDKRANNKLLTELAEELVTTCLPVAYQITPVHSPIQNDGDSCGLFVCLFFWRRFLKEAGNDYSSTGLLRRRWDVLKCILDYSDESTSKAKDNS
ncbi:hypothetical protein DVH05_009942 [Phytophthora capsici]|nr:hypothetical protein DVH05_009942 [Phytophthora capsici]